MKPTPHVLLVEDDTRLRHLVADYLQANSFTVTQFASGEGLIKSMQRKNVDIIILDIMLPGEDGLHLCKQIRTFYDGPLLFMTAKNEDIDQIIGLEMGADDYVVKPVEPRLLLARMHALLRRQKLQPSYTITNKVEFGKLTVDKEARSAVLDQQNVELTSHEFDLLWMLAEHAGEVVSRDQLYTDLLGREYDGLDRSIDVRISRLRKKLNDDAQKPYRIKTIWGKGFFFVADAWE